MKLVPNAIGRKVGRTVLVTGKHSPTLLFVGGVVGFGATVVLACRATLRVESVLDEHQEKLNDIQSVTHPKYSNHDRRHDKVVLYSQTIANLGRIYGPAVVVGSLSVAALTGSHNILSKRNAAVGAAYAALEKGFKEYRKRVVEELGEEKDREFRYGVVEVREVVQGKNGPESRVVKKIDTKWGRSIYARVFDEYNPNWQSIPEHNRIFLSSVQNYMNDRLHFRGHLFLNEVYDALGMDRSKAGQVVGWVVGNGENYVDFGLFDGSFDNNQFVNGNVGSVFLDFNVDGVVYDKLSDNEENDR